MIAAATAAPSKFRKSVPRLTFMASLPAVVASAPRRSVELGRRDALVLEIFDRARMIRHAAIGLIGERTRELSQHRLDDNQLVLVTLHGVEHLVNELVRH